MCTTVDRDIPASPSTPHSSHRFVVPLRGIMRVAAAAAIAGLGLGVVSGHEGFHVVSPTEGSIVTADR